jgi:sphingolipid delta-4 desaturase
MAPRDGFIMSSTPEPHAARRKEILSKHPEIAELFKPDPRPIPFVLAIIASQLVIAYCQHRFSWSWQLFLAVAWIYGGAASHALSLMTHELSHNLIFTIPVLNDCFGIFCNIAMGFPSSSMFKRYHMEHHQFQGDSDIDVDLPTAFEGRNITSVLMKSVWVFLMPAVYSLRPQHVRPKYHRSLDNINVIIVLASNFAVYSLCGHRGLLYLFVSTMLGMGFHPVAGHFIAEHFVFKGSAGFETFSYYGPLNALCWNVGYHNEHHDFPRVPGWKLPQVRALAPEYYDHLPRCPSWSLVIWNFITDPLMSPFSRVVRTAASK